MNMVILALMVVGCAIVVMFSQEFGNLFKKILAIRGMKLLLPLTVVTVLVVYYSHWLLWTLLQIKGLLHRLATILVSCLPFQTGALMLANIFIIAILSILPVLALDIWTKKKTYHSFQYAYLTSSMIWLLVAIVLTVN